jgi:hypothetical protein
VTATALLADFFFGANSRIQVAIGLGVAIVVREALEWSRYGNIRACKHAIASYVRTILDTPLDLARFDRVHIGDYLTLRRIANRARAGGIASVATTTGPARDLAETVDAPVLWLEAAKMHPLEGARVSRDMTCRRTSAPRRRRPRGR